MDSGFHLRYMQSHVTNQDIKLIIYFNSVLKTYLQKLLGLPAAEELKFITIISKSSFPVPNGVDK